MSRQNAEDGAFGYIAFAVIAITAFLQFMAPSSALESKRTQEPVSAASQPYYEVTYTYQRLPVECRALAASHSVACEAIRNAPPLVTEGSYAAESTVAQIASAESP